MKPADRAALALLARLRRDPEALARLFAVIRRHDDATLLAALEKGAPTKPAPTLLADVRARLAPLLASAQDKADALAAKVCAGAPPPAARGLAAMVRALENRYGAEAVRAGAVDLMRDIAAAAGRDSPP
ncbi:MAG: hypothetical protein KJS97_03415 [Alphaproteobacteria bacterium]|nr:hypothetical protein [Alphaproteobacteria bacterium]